MLITIPPSNSCFISVDIITDGTIEDRDTNHESEHYASSDSLEVCPSSQKFILNTIRNESRYVHCKM